MQEQVYMHVCVCVEHACARVFMDTDMNMGWENPLGLVCVSILPDENLKLMCNYKSSSSSGKSRPSQRHSRPQPGPPPPRSLPGFQTPNTYTELQR